jgi:hypothetical protein
MAIALLGLCAVVLVLIWRTEKLKSRIEKLEEEQFGMELALGHLIRTMEEDNDD